MPKILTRENPLSKKLEVYDPVRKKYVACTDEEKVRQMTLIFLTETLSIPFKHISVETEISINKLKKRTDILVSNSKLQHILIVECKAPHVKITQEVFEQIEIQVKYHGYIERQLLEVARQSKYEDAKIPIGFDYNKVKGLSNEVLQKLIKVRPATLGQASRISGITPAAISILLVNLRKEHKKEL